MPAHGTQKIEVSRLQAELEQATTAAENRELDLLSLSIEITQLRDDLRDRTQAHRLAEDLVREMRERLGRISTSLSTLEAERADSSCVEEELRVAIEELQVVTAELATANAALVEHNQVLEQRIAAEVAAREAEQTARFHQQKLEALGQLTGGVAHDFNNLLTVVLSALHLLQRADTDERRQRLLGRIGDAAQRGASLTHRLLAFGRRQALRPVPLDLQARLTELGDLLAHSLRGDMHVQTQAPPDLWMTRVDHGALELALLNLAVNSRDAMPQGGSITLAARNRAVETEAAAQMELQPGDYVEISVADSGAGMAPEVLARVFEPFFTTKPVGQGSGLGLAQVYGFARQSGGTATVSSTVGAGCTVSILLPADAAADRHPSEGSGFAEPAAAPPEAAAEPEVAASLLVVEDDPEVAAMVSDMLAQFGHAVTRVGSGEAALGVLANGRQIDLLFTDILLAGGSSGVDLAREVDRRRPGLPILLTSGYSGDMLGLVQDGPWPLLRKPYQPDQLRLAVQAALAGR